MKVLFPVSSLRYRGTMRLLPDVGNHQFTHVKLGKHQRKCTLCIYHRRIDGETEYIRCGLHNPSAHMVNRTAQTCMTFLYYNDLECTTCPEIDSVGKICHHTHCKRYQFKKWDEGMRKSVRHPLVEYY